MEEKRGKGLLWGCCSVVLEGDERLGAVIGCCWVPLVDRRRRQEEDEVVVMLLGFCKEIREIGRDGFTLGCWSDVAEKGQYGWRLMLRNRRGKEIWK